MNSIYIKKNHDKTPYILMWNEPKIYKFLFYLITIFNTSLKSNFRDINLKHSYQMLDTGFIEKGAEPVLVLKLTIYSSPEK